MIHRRHKSSIQRRLAYVGVHSTGDHEFGTRTRRRACSAPPEISMTRSREEQNGVSEEPGNRCERGSDCYTNLKNPSCHSHLCHAEFEVITRNVPASKEQELKRILNAFAYSLDTGKPFLLCSQDPSEHSCYDARRREIAERTSALLSNDSVSANQEVISHCCSAMAGSTSHHEICLACMPANVASRELWCWRRNRGRLILDHAARTHLVDSSAITCDNAICCCPRNCSYNDGSDSDSSVDILHYARKEDPEAVRILEEDFDKMMNQAG